MEFLVERVWVVRACCADLDCADQGCAVLDRAELGCDLQINPE